MHTSFQTIALLLAASLFLSACGSDSDDDSTPDTQDPTPEQPTPEPEPEPEPELQTGVFIDSPVGGVRFTTNPGGEEGITGSGGEYTYREGDTVQFSIGGIQLPEVTAKRQVTPLDMGGENADFTTPAVINVARLLQTLDDDSDPENGITIAEATASALVDTELDFTASTFETEATVAATLIERALVTEADAIAHFQGSLRDGLTGSWMFVEDNGNINLLTFFQDGHYVIAHSMADDGDQPAGSAEYGYYQWDPVDGSFSVVEVVRETDASGGLYNRDEPTNSDNMTFLLEGDVLTMVIEDEGSFEFTRVSDDTDRPLIGTWRFREPRADDPESSDLLTFFTATDYVFVHLWDSAASGNISTEWGSYEWTSDGVFTVSDPLVETDGPAGLYDVNDTDPMELSVSGNGELALAEGGSAETWARLGSYTVELRDFEGDVASAVVERVEGQFITDSTQIFTLDVIAEGTAGQYETAIGEQPVVTLEPDGTGTMMFGADVNTITDWSRSDTGVLTILEYDDGIDDNAIWTLTPIRSKTGDTVLVHQSDLQLNYIGRAHAE
ncbi:hypothetical protein EDC38_1839 [Marinimicrobium koreense]|uniref:Uncharacterized protein n=1 Tax=Marinimicrobium koreense TaxID=306545 RepID=A0A3N1P914_9GAMM|nr:hypothetical protein [Marinimicrobium koreense]ROQ21216.1 hypothetical protein EDC38_1839 [Marinimicrobium koreense]